MRKGEKKFWNNNCYEMDFKTIPQPAKHIFLTIITWRNFFIYYCKAESKNFCSHFFRHSQMPTDATNSANFRFIILFCCFIARCGSWKKKENKNSKITFRILLRWIVLSHCRHRSRFLCWRGNFQWKLFSQLMTHRSSSCIKHIFLPYSGKNERLLCVPIHAAAATSLNRFWNVYELEYKKSMAKARNSELIVAIKNCAGISGVILTKTIRQLFMKFQDLQEF